jgi:mRNA interferase MazF
MTNSSRGEVWLVDLGMAAKVRPAVILSVPVHDDERAVLAIVPYTTALRGGPFEVVLQVPWLQPGAFDVQGLRNIPGSVLLRRLGSLDATQTETIILAVKLWLQIP